MRAARLGMIAGLVLLLGGCGSSANSASTGSSTRTGASSTVSAALRDLSWAGQTDGWALAAGRCAAGSCARVEHTTDGGAHWQALPDPPAVVDTGARNCRTTRCVSAISFADRTVGYLYGPALLMSTDGGHSWHAQPGLQVETLSVSGGRAYRVAYRHVGCPGPCRPMLQSAPVGSARWRTSVDNLATPDRSGSSQIVGSGSTLLVALYGSQAGPLPAHAIVYRSADAGGTWQRRGDPCSAHNPNRNLEEDLVALAAAPGGFFAGLCTPHQGTPGALVVTSTNGGASWQLAGSLPQARLPQLIAAGSSTTLAVSTGPTVGSGPLTARLFISTDAGSHWRLAATDHQQLTPAGAPGWLGFQSPTLGRWLGDPHGIWTTRDTAARWTRTAIR